MWPPTRISLLGDEGDELGDVPELIPGSPGISTVVIGNVSNGKRCWGWQDALIERPLIERPLDEILQWLLQQPANRWPNETPVTPEQLVSWQNDAAILGYLRELTTVDLSACPLWRWVPRPERTLWTQHVVQ